MSQNNYRLNTNDNIKNNKTMEKSTTQNSDLWKYPQLISGTIEHPDVGINCLPIQEQIEKSLGIDHELVKKIANHISVIDNSTAKTNLNETELAQKKMMENSTLMINSSAGKKINETFQNVNLYNENELLKKLPYELDFLENSFKSDNDIQKLKNKTYNFQQITAHEKALALESERIQFASYLEGITQKKTYDLKNNENIKNKQFSDITEIPLSIQHAATTYNKYKNNLYDINSATNEKSKGTEKILVESKNAVEGNKIIQKLVNSVPFAIENVVTIMENTKGIEEETNKYLKERKIGYNMKNEEPIKGNSEMQLEAINYPKTLIKESEKQLNYPIIESKITEDKSKEASDELKAKTEIDFENLLYGNLNEENIKNERDEKIQLYKDRQAIIALEKKKTLITEKSKKIEELKKSSNKYKIENEEINNGFPLDGRQKILNRIDQALDLANKYDNFTGVNKINEVELNEKRQKLQIQKINMQEKRRERIILSAIDSENKNQLNNLKDIGRQFLNVNGLTMDESVLNAIEGKEHYFQNEEEKENITTPLHIKKTNDLKAEFKPNKLSKKKISIAASLIDNGTINSLIKGKLITRKDFNSESVVRDFFEYNGKHRCKRRRHLPKIGTKDVINILNEKKDYNEGDNDNNIILQILEDTDNSVMKELSIKRAQTNKVEQEELNKSNNQEYEYTEWYSYTYDTNSSFDENFDENEKLSTCEKQDLYNNSELVHKKKGERVDRPITLTTIKRNLQQEAMIKSNYEKIAQTAKMPDYKRTKAKDDSQQKTEKKIINENVETENNKYVKLPENILKNVVKNMHFDIDDILSFDKKSDPLFETSQSISTVILTSFPLHEILNAFKKAVKEDFNSNIASNLGIGSQTWKFINAIYMAEEQINKQRSLYVGNDIKTEKIYKVYNQRISKLSDLFKNELIDLMSEYQITPEVIIPDELANLYNFNNESTQLSNIMKFSTFTTLPLKLIARYITAPKPSNVISKYTKYYDNNKELIFKQGFQLKELMSFGTLEKKSQKDSNINLYSEPILLNNKSKVYASDNTIDQRNYNNESKEISYNLNEINSLIDNSQNSSALISIPFYSESIFSDQFLNGSDLNEWLEKQDVQKALSSKLEDIDNVFSNILTQKENRKVDQVEGLYTKTITKENDCSYSIKYELERNSYLAYLNQYGNTIKNEVSMITEIDIDPTVSNYFEKSKKLYTKMKKNTVINSILESNQDEKIPYIIEENLDIQPSDFLYNIKNIITRENFMDRQKYIDMYIENMKNIIFYDFRTIEAEMDRCIDSGLNTKLLSHEKENITEPYSSEQTKDEDILNYKINGQNEHKYKKSNETNYDDRNSDTTYSSNISSVNTSDFSLNYEDKNNNINQFSMNFDESYSSYQNSSIMNNDKQLNYNHELKKNNESIKEQNINIPIQKIQNPDINYNTIKDVYNKTTNILDSSISLKDVELNDDEIAFYSYRYKQSFFDLLDSFEKRIEDERINKIQETIKKYYNKQQWKEYIHSNESETDKYEKKNDIKDFNIIESDDENDEFTDNVIKIMDKNEKKNKVTNKLLISVENFKSNVYTGKDAKLETVKYKLKSIEEEVRKADQECTTNKIEATLLPTQNKILTPQDKLNRIKNLDKVKISSKQQIEQNLLDTSKQMMKGLDNNKNKEKINKLINNQANINKYNQTVKYDEEEKKKEIFYNIFKNLPNIICNVVVKNFRLKYVEITNKNKHLLQSIDKNSQVTSFISKLIEESSINFKKKYIFTATSEDFYKHLNKLHEIEYNIINSTNQVKNTRKQSVLSIAFSSFNSIEKNYKTEQENKSNLEVIEEQNVNNIQKKTIGIKENVVGDTVLDSTPLKELLTKGSYNLSKNAKDVIKLFVSKNENQNGMVFSTRLLYMLPPTITRKRTVPLSFYSILYNKNLNKKSIEQLQYVNNKKRAILLNQPKSENFASLNNLDKFMLTRVSSVIDPTKYIIQSKNFSNEETYYPCIEQYSLEDQNILLRLNDNNKIIELMSLIKIPITEPIYRIKNILEIAHFLITNSKFKQGADGKTRFKQFQFFLKKFLENPIAICLYITKEDISKSLQTLVFNLTQNMIILPSMKLVTYFLIPQTLIINQSKIQDLKDITSYPTDEFYGLSSFNRDIGKHSEIISRLPGAINRIQEENLQLFSMFEKFNEFTNIKDFEYNLNSNSDFEEILMKIGLENEKYMLKEEFKVNFSIVESYKKLVQESKNMVKDWTLIFYSILVENKRKFSKLYSNNENNEVMVGLLQNISSQMENSYIKNRNKASAQFCALNNESNKCLSQFALVLRNVYDKINVALGYDQKETIDQIIQKLNSREKINDENLINQQATYTSFSWSNRNKKHYLKNIKEIDDFYVKWWQDEKESYGNFITTQINRSCEIERQIKKKNLDKNFSNTMTKFYSDPDIINENDNYITSNTAKSVKSLKKSKITASQKNVQLKVNEYEKFKDIMKIRNVTSKPIGIKIIRYTYLLEKERDYLYLKYNVKSTEDIQYLASSKKLGESSIENDQDNEIKSEQSNELFLKKSGILKKDPKFEPMIHLLDYFRDRFQLQLSNEKIKIEENTIEKNQRDYCINLSCIPFSTPENSDIHPFAQLFEDIWTMTQPELSNKIGWLMYYCNEYNELENDIPIWVSIASWIKKFVDAEATLYAMLPYIHKLEEDLKEKNEMMKENRKRLERKFGNKNNYENFDVDEEKIKEEDKIKIGIYHSNNVMFNLNFSHPSEISENKNIEIKFTKDDFSNVKVLIERSMKEIEILYNIIYNKSKQIKKLPLTQLNSITFDKKELIDGIAGQKIEWKETKNWLVYKMKKNSYTYKVDVPDLNFQQLSMNKKFEEVRTIITKIQNELDELYKPF